MGISPPPSSDQKPKIVMGYPSVDRYPPTGPPGYPVRCPPIYAVQYATAAFNPHQAYPSTTPYNSHQFNHLGKVPNVNPSYPPSVNSYHYEPQYNPLVKEPDNLFGRMMLILMVVLVGIMCLMSLVMWFLFGTYIPEFEVMSLTVTNFTTTNTTLTGVWEANINVKNLNGELSLQFDRTRGSVFYRDIMLGISSAQPFQVEKKKEAAFKLRVDSEPMISAHTTESWMLPALTEDRGNRLVIFSLRLSIETNFSSAHMVYRQETLRVMCENLPITFTPDGQGIYNRAKANPCLIRLRETQE